jgi:uncharacterized Ntn-hydrolase superfamily protein
MPNLAHTYSIVARDPVSGEMGVAVQSHWFSVGSMVSWAEAGVGAVATQSFVNPSFGPLGLERLKQGRAAAETLKMLLDSDEGHEFRQVAIIDTQGRAAAHTGANCIPQAGHITSDNFSVQANLMASDRVWPAMAAAFTASQRPLAERMVAALVAGQAEGGDIRGQQSAALLVVKGETSGKVWQDRPIDLRVENHPRPVEELQRLLQVFRAYEYMNQGDAAIERGNVAQALAAYQTAQALCPDNLEMKFWHAVGLTNLGQIEAALPIFREIFWQEANWAVVIQELLPIGLLKADPSNLARILAQVEK